MPGLSAETLTFGTYARAAQEVEQLQRERRRAVRSAGGRPASSLAASRSSGALPALRDPAAKRRPFRLGMQVFHPL